MSAAASRQRLAELRALGPTPDGWDGSDGTSVRPATLEQCWLVIEQLDAELASETFAEERLSRLVHALKEHAKGLRAEAVLRIGAFKRSSPASPPRVAARELLAEADAIAAFAAGVMRDKS